jgi:glutathione synthase/RimK-type ligase-like ATP-grasp enzyme
MFIYPYNAASESAKSLALALDIKRIALKASRYKGNNDKVVINWGASSLPVEVSKSVVLNTPEAVSRACNKIEFFNCLAYTFLAVPSTESRETANKWLEDGHTVVARTKVDGHSGEGIVLIESTLEMVDAPLYTKYIPKKSEWRVHVARNGIFVQRKMRNLAVPDEHINWRIRNRDGGFIFANKNIGEVPEDLVGAAIKTVAILGLDFGAVDLIYNERLNKSFVLEVNTAPGLEGSTLEFYREMFSKWQ